MKTLSTMLLVMTFTSGFVIGYISGEQNAAHVTAAMEVSDVK